MPYLHIPGVTATAVFATENRRRFRYRLEITKVGSAPNPLTACVVMQNPSYAGEDVADKSVQFMEKIVFLRGFPEFIGIERLIVVNQFALIQTNGFLGRPEDVGKKNNAAIEAAINDSEIVIIGWGKSNPHVERQEFVLNLLRDRHRSGQRCYQTSSHPSRGRYEGFIQAFTP